MRVSTFIVSMLIVGLFVAVFMNFFSELNDKYTPDVAYNSSEWETYNQLSTLKNDAKEIQNKTTNIAEKQGALDLIGSYFSSAYSSFRLTINSISSFEKISDKAVEDSNMGVNATHFKTVLTTIVIVLIIIGVILSALMKYPV